MDKLKAPGKPFDISKRAVWEAWEKVRANKGAPGVDAVTIAEFESDLKNSLYKIWGTGSPPAPTSRHRCARSRSPSRMAGARGFWACPPWRTGVAQTVAAGVIEAGAGQVFHPGSYGYRPGRCALDAVAVCRRRCWENDWVIDLEESAKRAGTRCAAPVTWITARSSGG